MENRVPYGGSFINRTKVIALVLFYGLSKTVKAIEIEGA